MAWDQAALLQSKEDMADEYWNRQHQLHPSTGLLKRPRPDFEKEARSLKYSWIEVRGKELWGYVDGTISAPETKEKEQLAKWKAKDAQIMSWIFGSMDPSMILNLRRYKTSKDMWGYLKKIYNQSNAARRFQLELELGQLSQGSLTIQEFYSSFENLWGEYTDIVHESVPSEGLRVIQSAPGSFNGHLPIVELLREEQRLVTQTFIEQKAQNTAPIPVAYATQGKHKGHIIKNCLIRPTRKSGIAYNASFGSTNAPNFGQSTVTPEMIQQIIVNAFSTLGISGNKNSAHKPCYFDSATSNHMTSSTLPLNNVQKYKGDLQIHTADCNTLPITAIGDISSTLHNVFVSPKLSTNLISVVQLVDSNCTVQFSNSGCLVQDQVSGKMIAKGPKVGRLFSLLPSPSLVSKKVSCNAVECNNQVWHKH
ncbi:hypothetical protein AgCh_008409 [Apium graveolens]